MVWLRGDEYSQGRSSGGLVAAALTRAGVPHAPVLHPADADAFLTGTTSYSAVQNNPRATGRRAIRGGVGILVGGVLAGVGAGVGIRYGVEGSEHALSNLVTGATVGLSVAIGSTLIIVGGLNKRKARTLRNVSWEITGDFHVRIGIKKPQRVRVQKRGTEPCGEDPGCETGITAARENAKAGLGAGVASGVDVALSGRKRGGG